MKITSSLVVAFVLVSAFGSFAADKSGAKPKDTRQTKVKTTNKAAEKPGRQVALTGSYIKRDIKRNGIVTDGPNPVVVLDSETIRNSGASDLRELLVFRGITR